MSDSKRKDIEFLPEEAEPEPLEPLPGPRTYRIELSRGIKKSGHVIKPGEIGTLTVRYGLDPDWIASMVGRGVAFKDEPI